MSEKRKYWTLVGVVNKRRDGEGTYVKILKDIPAGVVLSVQDPRDRLNEEQKAQLEANGKVEIVKDGRTIKTVYANTSRELYLAPEKE